MGKKQKLPLMGKVFEVFEADRAEEQSKTPYANDVEITNDVVFKTLDGRDFKMDIYVPKREIPSPRPAILLIPGGGWMINNRPRRIGYATLLAYLGAVVFVSEYRMCPETRFPADLEDNIDCFNYIVDHKDEYNIDVNNIVLTGDSAGGHLSACLACAATTPGYAEEAGVPMPKAVPSGCVFISGAFSLDSIGRIPLGFTFITRHVSGLKTKSAFRKWKYYKTIHPWKCLTKDFPKSYNSGGKFDLCCLGDAKRMADKLSECGVENEYFVGQQLHCDHCYVYRIPFAWARKDLFKALEWYVKLQKSLGVDMAAALETEKDFLLK